MTYTSMDPRTAKIIAQLQLQDIMGTLDSLYDDEPRPTGDELSALTLIQRDLQHQIARLDDQMLVLQILREENDDRITIKKLLEEEVQADNDHQFALRLAGLSVSDQDGTSISEYQSQFDGLNDCDDIKEWEMAKQLYISAFGIDNLEDLAEGGPVLPVANRATLHGVRNVVQRHQDPELEEFITCNVCMDTVSVKITLRLQCSHNYCRDCLLDLFTSSISNPTLFPPRCCKVPVPLETCRVILPKELIKDFDLKVEELATPNPTYCANAECSEFIQPKNIRNEIGTCVFCTSTTCTQCKNRSHNGFCPSDPHVQLLMDAAKRSKWQQCAKCNNMVELSQGCFHMT